MRGATSCNQLPLLCHTVSIHAPLARGDAYPVLCQSLHRFQSTPLLRGATEGGYDYTKDPTFQSTPLLRGATARSFSFLRYSLFQSTPLLRGATIYKIHHVPDRRVSIHAPLARGDLLALISLVGFSSFNPRPSCEGRRIAGMVREMRKVSIHAPLARGDVALLNPSTKDKSFNPRPSCEGRRLLLFLRQLFQLFQSTPLLRGATVFKITNINHENVSIHAPLARGDAEYHQISLELNVSIHAPLARGDFYLLT